MQIKKLNKTVVIKIPQKTEIDIDALNIISSNVVELLLPCKYSCVKSKHILTFTKNGTFCNKEIVCETDFYNLLIDLQHLVIEIKINSLQLSNVLIDKKAFFYFENHFRFIYIPIYKKEKCSIYEFYVNFINLFCKKLDEANRFKQEIIGKADEDVLAYIEYYLGQINNYNELSSNYNENELSEAPTSVLTPMNNEGNVSSEMETTFFSYETSYSELKENKSNETNATDMETVIISPAVDCYFNGENPQEIPPSCYLTVTSSNTRIEVDRIPFTIGSSADNSYVLDNNSVSRHHILISYDNGNYWLSDLGSKNGTFYEGVALEPNCPEKMYSGDLFTLGNEILQIYIEA